MYRPAATYLRLCNIRIVGQHRQHLAYNDIHYLHPGITVYMSVYFAGVPQSLIIFNDESRVREVCIFEAESRIKSVQGRVNDKIATDVAVSINHACNNGIEHQYRDCKMSSYMKSLQEPNMICLFSIAIYNVQQEKNCFKQSVQI